MHALRTDEAVNTAEAQYALWVVHHATRSERPALQDTGPLYFWFRCFKKSACKQSYLAAVRGLRGRLAFSVSSRDDCNVATNCNSRVVAQASSFLSSWRGSGGEKASMLWSSVAFLIVFASRAVCLAP